MKPPSPTGVRHLHRRLGLGLVLLAAVVVLRGASPPRAALAAHARGVLHGIMESEQSFVRVHAAEALIAAGEADAVRAFFLRELPATEGSAFRIGVWRVLATTASSNGERESWIGKVEQVYCDPAATDRTTALETLCKLGHRVSGRSLELVRHESVGAPSTPTVLALWSAQLAGEPNALAALTGLLTASDPKVRRTAAYALRWLHPADPATRQSLAHAAAVEPAGSNAYAYILGAALTVDADPVQAASWEAALDQVLATGATDARFEASWTLRHRYNVANLPPVAKLLDLPASENDTRVGAAMIILTTLARP